MSNMIILDLVQGTKEWIESRRFNPNASEAASVFGVCKHGTRGDLLRLKKFGTDKEVGEWVQKNLFDKGHDIEAKARVIIESRIGEGLFPICAKREIDGIELYASLDGLTIDDGILFECKSWNAELVKMVESQDLSPAYYWQLEQQLAVTLAEYVIFTVSDGTDENTISMNYYPVEGRRERLVAAWKQFYLDLADYQLPAIQGEFIPAIIADLPTIKYKMNGLKLSSNLTEYKLAAQKLVEDSQLPLETDQEFADREALCKKFKDAEGKLKELKAQVVGEVTDIDNFCKELDAIVGFIAKARLNGENMVLARKEEKRANILNQANAVFNTFINELNDSLGVKLPAIDVDFIGAIKGKKLFSKMIDAVETKIANGKLKANEIADDIRTNLDTLKSVEDYSFLFNDKQSIITKSPDDFTNLVNSRIQAHEVAVAEKKKADDLRMQQEIERQVASAKAEESRKAEAERIRIENEAKAALAEQARIAEAERLRIEKEAKESQIAALAEQKRLHDADIARIANYEKEHPTDIRQEETIKPASLQTDIFDDKDNDVGIKSGIIKVIKRPDDEKIVKVISNHYQVSESLAYQWIKEVK